MKKLLCLVLIAIFMVSFTGVYANEIVLNDANPDNGDLTVTTSTPTIILGQTAYFTATTTAPGGATFYLMSDNWTTPLGITKVGTTTESINVLTSNASFKPTAIGTYTITYTIAVAHNDNANENSWIYGTATTSLEVTTVITVENPAAPAVAARLLNAAGVKPKYGKNRNYISDVAKHMGPTTDFDGVSKDDVTAYEAAVKAFLGL